MNTSLRSLLSAATGFGLAGFTVFSASTAGILADTTVIAFSLLAIYGLLEIAMISYTAPRFVSRNARRAAATVTTPELARVSTLVTMPSNPEYRRAA